MNTADSPVQVLGEEGGQVCTAASDSADSKGNNMSVRFTNISQISSIYQFHVKLSVSGITQKVIKLKGAE